MPERCDIVIVGAGLVGLATAHALLERRAGDVIVLEAESAIATHQSGHNSGVIHSGLYYAPGSLRARLCTEGREALERFCAEHGVRHERCGKVVVATTELQCARLDELHARGEANGLTGLRRLSADELPEREPSATGLAALLVPQTGVVDFAEVARALAAAVEQRGGQVRLGTPLVSARQDGDRVVAQTPAGAIACRRLVACAGLQADRIARRCGVRPRVRIVPFRGEYARLRPDAADLVRHIIYPVPDPRFPFLGVHLTRMIDGAVEVGPTAVLSLARHGYRRGAFSARDVFDLLRYPGFWRLGLRHWRIAVAERRRAGRPRHLAAHARRLVPALTDGDLEPGHTGVRAMAVSPSGAMLDDFHILREGPMVHVLNAPSPAATACLAIGRHVAALIE